MITETAEQQRTYLNLWKKIMKQDCNNDVLVAGWMIRPKLSQTVVYMEITWKKEGILIANRHVGGIFHIYLWFSSIGRKSGRMKKGISLLFLTAKRAQKKAEEGTLPWRLKLILCLGTMVHAYSHSTEEAKAGWFS